jgi:hypothetical protein
MPSEWNDWNCTMKDKKNTVGQLLVESLTPDQIACMLEVVASAAGIAARHEQIARKLETDRKPKGREHRIRRKILNN